MKSREFYIGRHMKLFELLHREYCMHMGNNEIYHDSMHPWLFDNAMFNSIVKSPVNGLIQLRKRMLIYVAWANTVTGEDAKCAKQIVTCLGRTSLKIAQGYLPERFTTYEQLQVLLGYLSAIPNLKKNGSYDKQKYYCQVSYYDETIKITIFIAHNWPLA